MAGARARLVVLLLAVHSSDAGTDTLREKPAGWTRPRPRGPRVDKRANLSLWESGSEDMANVSALDLFLQRRRPHESSMDLARCRGPVLATPGRPLVHREQQAARGPAKALRLAFAASRASLKA